MADQYPDLYERDVDGQTIWYCYVRYVDEHGRRQAKRRSTGVRSDGTVRSKQAADAKRRDFERAVTVGGASAARTSKTLKQALAALIADQVLAGRSAANLEIITDKAGRLYDHFTEARAMHTIDEEAVKAYATEARQKRAVSTVLREMLVLSQAFAAVKLTPPAFPDIGEPPPGRDRVLELNEQRRLLSAVSAKRKLSVLCFLQLGGIRQSEYSLVVEIDWAGRFAHVAGTKTKNSDRWVPIPDELFAEMLPHRHEWVGHRDEGWLLSWLKVDRDLRKAAQRAGLAVFSCNDLRRTYATFMARAGVSSLQLATLMGTSERMLAAVYARIEKRGEHMHEAVAKGVPTLRTKAPSALAQQKNEA